MSYYVYKKPWVRAAVGLYDAVGRMRQKHPPKTNTLPHHICFIMLHQIGDIVMTLPTVEAVIAMHPQAKISFIVGQGPAQLLINNPWGASVFPFAANWQKVVRQLQYDPTQQSSEKTFLSLIQKTGSDCVIIFHPDLQVNKLIGQTDLPHSFGFTNAGGGFWLTHPITMPQSGHQVERNYSLARAFSQTFDRPLPKLQPPRLIPEPAAQTTVQELFKQHTLQPSRVVVLHPFASAPTKNWNTQNWEQVIEWLIKEKWAPVIIGGPNDHLATNKKTAISLCGKLSLAETAALLHQAALFIGIDSGPGHIAAAVGCPSISIFSSVNRPDRWAPYGDTAKLTILHKPVTDRQAFPYELREIPPGTEGNPYSDKITTPDVIAAAKKLLSPKTSKP